MAKVTSDLKAVALAYLTPKQLRPVPTALFIAVITWVVSSSVRIAANPNPYEGITRDSLGRSFPFLAAAFLGIWSVLALGRLVQDRKPDWGWVFYAANLGAGSLTLVFRQILAQFVTDYPKAWLLLGNQIIFVIFISMACFFFQQSIGVATNRLDFEVQRANKALADLEKQQQLLIQNQEALRRELATYLHDGLQSNLVVLGMQMQQATQNLPEKYRGIGNSFVEELERMRRIDVRTAIRQLSPDLENLSLGPALAELAKRYEKVMKVRFDLDGVSNSKNLEFEVKLGAYRIVEQALLNALVHAHAEQAMVKVRVNSGLLSLEVSNKGTPLPRDFIPGSGLAIVDAWAKSLSGSYQIVSSSEGTRLQAELQI